MGFWSKPASDNAPPTLPFPAGRLPDWLRSPHSALIVAAIFFVALLWPFMRRGDQSEFIVCYVRAAQRMLACETIHRDEPVAYAYPPAMAMLTIPLAHLPARGALVAWYLINVAATSAVFAGAWKLTGGPSLVRLEGRWLAVFWLAVLLCFRFVSAPLENQQFDTVIAALLTAGCLLLGRGRELPGAVLLGLAAGLKCTPLLFAPYLLWRGRLVPACALVLVAVAINRLPDWLWPQLAGQSYLADWTAMFLVRVGHAAPGVWDSDLVLNQSLSGLFNRFAQAGLVLSADRLPSGLAVLTPATVTRIRWMTYGASLLLLAVSAWRLGRPSRGWSNPGPDEGAAQDWGPLQMGVESGAIFCLMLLLSPMSSKAHYVVLVLPALLFARALVERLLPAGRLLLALLLATGPLTSKGLTGKALGDLTLAWGFPTWYVLVLLLAMWLLMPFTRVNRAASSAADSITSNLAA